MNPLYRNDRPGAYPPSWYAASTNLPPERPPLEGDARADLCVVGAGYTGLWAALTAARAGLKVIVLDAHRAGFGASGRNGGQVGMGYNKPQTWLEARLGEGTARALWDAAEDARAQLRLFCEREAPEAEWRPGVAHGAYSAAEAQEDAREAEHLATRYDYDRIEVHDADGFREIVRSPLYQGGTIDRGAAHIHPLRYALALARAAEAAGATIHERSEVTRVDTGIPARVSTARGTVTADHVIVAGNGYLPNLAPPVNARVMPINSFIAATEPLPDRWHEVLAEDIAVADSKFVVNYYRFSEDRRFLFGGRESYSLGFPADISTALVKRMTSLFPQLDGVRVDHTWGGTLGITMTRLPHLARLGENVMSGAGFSGHGVALSGFAGRVMAEAVLGQAGRFDVMAQLPVPRFPGGSAFRAPLLTLAMTWYALRDRLGI
ncbi:NAD(P)/FAD-dependent oxidoreductase [Wenxinia marina]|uniref:Gamma-glutamylputrescine oxidase n=1 Tax=Wenxinia marina DSM 24838 TaxID=1123501 RepID=A0A0D0NIU0_9RHOB|nr:FAD-binding oxidoreductase [Wenxinia marina]KIQ68210.1 gamma-glutamylputrescine oxidase [Wenxinia marina DSM 24838]GGL76772.1 oxidoreductase [Wenxinia marina]